MFENEGDYCHYFSADHKEKMKDWVLSIRNNKNLLCVEETPQLFYKDEPKENYHKEQPFTKDSLLAVGASGRQAKKLVDADEQISFQQGTLIAQIDERANTPYKPTGKTLLSFE